MSTSILDHGWDVKDYTYKSTEYAAGAIWFHIEKNHDKGMCPSAGGESSALQVFSIHPLR